MRPGGWGLPTPSPTPSPAAQAQDDSPDVDWDNASAWEVVQALLATVAQVWRTVWRRYPKVVAWISLRGFAALVGALVLSEPGSRGRVEGVSVDGSVIPTSSLVAIGSGQLEVNATHTLGRVFP